MRRRLDAELVRRGLLPSRNVACEAIESRRVLVGGAVATKPSRLVDAAEAILVEGDAPRFVSRGGEKLDGALERFGIDVADDRVLDAGASTGGFTDCLLQRGAAQVVALDVGHGQIHEKLRGDPRVTVLERTNMRTVEPSSLGVFDGAVADLSFISLTAVIPQIMECVRPTGWLVMLVKPQFESERPAVSKGKGVIRDPELWLSALRRVVSAATDRGAVLRAAMCSPLHGGSGNREFLVDLVKADAAAGLCGPSPAEVDAVLRRAVEEGGAP